MDSAAINSAVERLLAEVKTRPQPLLFAGADGFMDEIIRVVDKRYDANRFDAIRTIGEYALRLGEAAGKSTNLEFHVERVKAGGNGPLLCEAFGRLGGSIHYIGCLGWPDVDPLFDPLKAFGRVQTIAPAAVTLAAEFDDGKIMYGKHQSLREVTWANFLRGCGGEDGLAKALGEADAFSVVNWTMVPFLNEVLEGVLGIVQKLGVSAPRVAFFDLCDPAKRTREDLRRALELIGRYTSVVKTVILGLNEKESLEVCDAYGLDAGSADLPGLIRRAEAISRETGINEVMIHPTRCAVVWSKGESGATEGPFCAAPRLTTGAGDHFNGGYVYARVMGLGLADSLVIGKCVSGFYVREGRGPSPGEVLLFGQRWAHGRLDPWQSPPECT